MKLFIEVFIERGSENFLFCFFVVFGIGCNEVFVFRFRVKKRGERLLMDFILFFFVFF